MDQKQKGSSMNHKHPLGKQYCDWKWLTLFIVRMTKEKIRRPPPGYMAEHILQRWSWRSICFNADLSFAGAAPLRPSQSCLHPVRLGPEKWMEIGSFPPMSTRPKKGFPTQRSEPPRAVQQRNRPKGTIWCRWLSWDRCPWLPALRAGQLLPQQCWV